MESFAYGGAPRARRQIGKPVLVALVLALVAGIGAVVFSMTRSGGEAVATHVRQTVEQTAQAYDVQAQSSLSAALTSAKAAFVESASFEAADAEYLTSFGTGTSYVEGTTVSSGPTVVSVQVSAQAWGAAAMSRSGTCFWIRETVAGGTAYGSGDPCTGAAAMSATNGSF